VNACAFELMDGLCEQLLAMDQEQNSIAASKSALDNRSSDYGLSPARRKHKTWRTLAGCVRCT